MMGCFSTSQTDGTEESFRMSLRSLLATKDTYIPAPCIAKKIIERKLGIGTRKTLQARTNMLDTACHSLAKAKQRSLVSLPPSYYLKSEVLLFPLPLPPGYKPTTTASTCANKKPSSKPPSRKLLIANSPSARVSNGAANSSSTGVRNGVVHGKECNSISEISKKSDDFSGDFSISSSTSSSSSSHSSSNNHLYAYEALIPTSPTSSSSVFSAATSYSLSQSSSFNSSSTTFSCSSLSFENQEECSSVVAYKNVGCPLKEFSAMEIARALMESSGHSQKLSDGAMGPFYKVFLPEEKCSVALTKVATKLSRKKWRIQIQALTRLGHANLSKVIGFSYERAKYVDGMEGMANYNMGFIVYEDIGDETLEELLEDVEKGLDWSTRLKIATGIAEGLSFMLENTPSHVDYGYLTTSNIRVDWSLNAKLFDFVLLQNNKDNLKEKRLCSVVQSLGDVLLQVFGFVSYPQNVDDIGLGNSLHHNRSYPPNDAKVVADLVANCLLQNASLRPSVLQVARVLHSIEPTEHVGDFSIKRSKSFTYRKRRSLSFG